MDWDDLRIFLAVARTESLSGAGRRLGMDASTVGRRVMRLEAATGAALFLKTPQGYQLTNEGARLVAPAEAAEQAAQAAAEAVNREAGITGQLRIGAPDGCANYLLPQVAMQISRLHPGLEIQIVALPRVVNLTRREADMAIAVSPPDTGRLTVQRLADYRLHLAAHDDYLSRRPPIRDLGDLKGHRMISYIPDMIFDRELDYLSATGMGAAQITSNSVAVQMQAVRCGAGLGIVHDFALPFAPGVRRVLTDRVSLKRSFWLIRHADDRASRRLSLLADAVAQGVRAEVARLEARVSADEAAMA
ncbi:LysR family transcriptional regulator [Paracoccus sp. 1_MG-2023]|uniref:LysR family transcriptional regulator n=1 Tax=unclassified Paracoccus (in: a-proteobacteria) TaxID=2688777 RepID=UPI001C08097C|nr:MULTISPECIES: LysR family transcriptional regulator [unclassified Paracoccus (in: a-proteobacteria)]MBU2959040.1 LysR family transcriptional regulator [Paracoccus sp. C2R09]MDO6669013.1 LysR family transcriptional regulator [Paracoccus sp. 1_MG-2023]